MPSSLMSQEVMYDIENASFYPLQSAKHRMPASYFGDQQSLTSALHKSSKCYLPCVGTDNGSLDNWQKRHPNNWTNEDVLDLIYFVASTSSNDTVSSVRGEKFQGVYGSDLYHMTKEDFIQRDPKHGSLLFEVIQELLAQSDFTPPEDMPLAVEPPPELTKLEVPVKEEPLKPDSQYGQLPKPVEDLMMDDNDYLLQQPPVCLIGDRRREELDERMYVRIDGHTYDIDSDTDFRGIIQPSAITGDPMELDDSSRCVYTDLTTVRPGYQHHAMMSSSSFPIDLRTSPSQRRRDDVVEYRTSDSPVVRSLHCHRQTPIHKSTLPPLPSSLSRHEPKRKQVKTRTPSIDKEKKKATKPDGSSGGRHLWEFIRDLLRSNDSDDGGNQPNAIIRWENREEGIFRILDSKRVAELWGRRKRNQTMTYEKLSRALRWSRTFGFLSEVPKDGRYPKKLCFRFGHLANWQEN